MHSIFDLNIFNGACKDDTEGEFTFMSPHGNRNYFIVSEDLTRWCNLMSVTLSIPGTSQWTWCGLIHKLKWPVRHNKGKGEGLEWSGQSAINIKRN